MISANSNEVDAVTMEVFIISFLVFVVFSLALAIGLLLGRGPIHASCRPDGSKGSCAHKGHCTLPCAKRRDQVKLGET